MQSLSLPEPARRVAAFALLILAELALLSFVFQVLTPFECSQTRAAGMCRVLPSIAARAIVLMAMSGLLVWLRPGLFALLSPPEPAAARLWRAVHATGLILLLAPAFLALGGGLADNFNTAIALWVPGLVAAACGALFWLATPRSLVVLGRTLGRRGAVMLIGAMGLPDIVWLLAPLWDGQTLAIATLNLVALVLHLAGAELMGDPGQALIGANGFLVQIAAQCSGIEGMVLTAGFACVYALFNRGDLRITPFLLVLLPLALLASWVLNVLRIAALIGIGAAGAPGLALNGFHSHAGWLFFSFVALGLMVLAERWPLLHRRPRQVVRTSLRSDATAAAILPFALFMLASLVTHAIFAVPDVGYPLRAAALAVAVALFWPVWRGWDWRPAALPVAAGVLVGVAWLALMPVPDAGPDSLAAAIGALPPLQEGAWFVARLTGGILLVPLVEEAFFRGYLMRRLDRGTLAWRLAAVGVSSAAFATLHGMWLLAFGAGMVFAAMALWRGRVTDAIWAHAAANTVLAGWALWRDNPAFM